jgi:uncharacterized membrane protein YhaH (DUF805 family)
MYSLWARLFGLEAPVGRRFYAIAGISLMLLKYAVDAAAVWLVAGLVWHPLRYLSPLISMRQQELGAVPTEMFGAMAVWALPFMWIGVSMSVRRAVDAGKSPWLGLCFFVPVFNWLVMLALCLLPSAHVGAGQPPPSLHPYRTAQPVEVPRPTIGEEVSSALLGIAAGLLVAGSMAALSIYALALYGAALFFGTPLVMSAVSAWFYNRKRHRSTGWTLLIGQVTMAVAACVALLFALEGAVCLLMAMPIVCALGLVGSLIGRAIARSQQNQMVPALLALLALPVLAGFESRVAEAPIYEVQSSIDIDAAPEIVWKHVIGFSELPPATELEFRMGIATPQRARIEGEGVGAVRHCEFSTGPFVEPITVWDPPRRLGFDVHSQPHPMHEWSPYREITPPPHLEHTIRSRRGEFRLIALEGGRTRLEGSTWYELSMHPQAYWTLWSDALIHSVHLRVLRHIRGLSEAEAR